MVISPGQFKFFLEPVPLICDSMTFTSVFSKRRKGYSRVNSRKNIFFWLNLFCVWKLVTYYYGNPFWFIKKTHHWPTDFLTRWNVHVWRYWIFHSFHVTFTMVQVWTSEFKKICCFLANDRKNIFSVFFKNSDFFTPFFKINRKVIRIFFCCFWKN